MPLRKAIAKRIKLLEQQHLPGNRCPGCGTRTEGCSAVADASDAKRPKPGDVSICAHCGEICVFTETLGLARFPADETPPREALEASRLVRSLSN